MKPLVSFVGTSGCGKTTLIEKVITELVNRGYKVSTVKHDAHDFQMDKEGKDTWRHKNAGASAIIISNKNKFALISDVEEEKSIFELVAMLPENTDIVVAEGFKQELQHKIEVYRNGFSTKLQCRDDNKLMAIATDCPNDPEVQGFHLLDLNNTNEIVDFIINKLNI
ncbi:molybdopterin-guanine dinucleotide biosynthesis protein B [Denitrovibrio acetiphilus DSM 12809]|uniref:Molybdopterin-guanine dinucleotide biosynthesis protein B n=1 Tax=Denitrovibrio acetiphilus (strain DSM 12809 / NBRC 114555 / N2460) TaxID=522772 RepID=D4H8T9_DENA2|nr:molybdopterin-guanine dinucleotide biosynthesis protein B [Denitrovibrio acetiphilus]ADD68438.1 molybdopterin-guanine dinucleotide biosynthesis protein B [Denitrovibrio acetiphilus DSM 12809]